MPYFVTSFIFSSLPHFILPLSPPFPISGVQGFSGMQLFLVRLLMVIFGLGRGKDFRRKGSTHETSDEVS